jgi:hypothetical protein
MAAPRSLVGATGRCWVWFRSLTSLSHFVDVEIRLFCCCVDG